MTTDTITINRTGVTRVALEIKDEVGPEETYRSITGSRSCTYQQSIYGPWTPACLVGRILHRLGVGEAVLRAMDACSGTMGGAVIHSEAVAQVLRTHGVEVTTVALAMLTRMQGSQDAGSPWHAAIDRGLEAGE